MDDIYREQLMDHYKNPQNRGHMDGSTKEQTKNNPFCGDVIKMQIKIADGKIEDIKFDGAACAVSVASASVLTGLVKGKSIEDAKKITKQKLVETLGVELTTSRMKCAELPLETLHSMLEGLEE